MGTWALFVAIGLWVATLAAARIHDYRRHDGPRPSAPLVVLAVVEGLLAFLALYVAVCIRFGVPLLHVHQLEREFGPLWPRGLVYASVVVGCMLAFGLYSRRQRAELMDVFLRLLGALVVSSGAMAAIYYLLPSLHLWRGVAALAAILAGGPILAARAVVAVAGPREH